MGSYPLNLIVRFLLELTAFFSSGLRAWHVSEVWSRFILVILVPLTLAILWGVFIVPDDPSRSGKAPVPVQGVIRFVLEIAIFILTVWALYYLGYVIISLVTGFVVLAHYSLSYDRIKCLLKQKV